MRIKILKHTAGIMDGVSLAKLLPGLTYELPEPLGVFLVTKGAAEEDRSTERALVIPLDEAGDVSGVTRGVSIPSNKDSDDDRPSSSKRRKKHR